jgi:histidinol-phosphate aminotransferase
MAVTTVQPRPIEVAEHIRNLKPYHPGRPIEEVQREYGLKDVIKLASNENPLGPSPMAVQAMQDACTQVGLYPDGACYELKQALSGHLDVSTDHIAVGNGSDELIQYIGLAFLEPGDEVIQGHPTFVRYEAAAILNQCKLISVPLSDYTHDVGAMARACSPRTRLLFIANPNNPTGTMNTDAEIRRLLGHMPDRAILVLDEAYQEYAEDARFPDSRDYVREGYNVIALRTFSKVYGLAGTRVGYAIARPNLIADLSQVREPFNVNTVAQAGAIASLHDPGQITRSIALNNWGKEFYYDACRRLGLGYIPSQANFVLINLKRPAADVAKALESKGVIVRPGAGLGLPDFIRVTTGTRDECERFVTTLEQVLR